MAKGIYIIGTDTEVGKTVVAAGIMATLLKSNTPAAYFKPVSSGWVEVNGSFHPADAFFVKQFSGFKEEEQIVSPFSYREEVAPHFAARREGKPVSLEVIKDRYRYLKRTYEVIIGEGAGGLAVPLNDEGYMQYSLIRELGFSCALVARAGLGTINHTLLTVRLAREEGLQITSIFINRYTDSPLERENMAVIRALSGVEHIFVVPLFVSLEGKEVIPFFDDLLIPQRINSILAPLPEVEGR
jgi:dethiobiotin synthetase